jgi:myosin heavy subunit
LIYWPLELFPFLIQNNSLELSLVKEWSYAVSQFVKLKRKHASRFKLVNGMHLFPEFSVKDVPLPLCSRSPLTELVDFYKLIFVKDSALELPNYAESLEVLNASESNTFHSETRSKQFDRLKAESSRNIDEGKEVKAELLVSKSECENLSVQLQRHTQEKLIATKEIEQLKQQVLLLQNALENQHTKAASLVTEHQSVLKEKENKFLEKSNQQAADIESLKNDLTQALQTSQRLKNDLQGKELIVLDLEKKFKNQQKQNESLQEHLVQAQIHIEKTHQTLYKRLNDAETKFSAEKKSLNESLSKLKLELEASQHSIVKITKDYQEQIKIKNSDVKELIESKERLLSELANERETLQIANRNLNDKAKALSMSLQQQESIKEELASKAKELLHERKQRQRIEQKLTSKLEKLEQALSVSESRRNILEYEFRQVKNSRYWKLLAPAKSIKGRLFNTDKEVKKDIALLYTSNLFDAKWYLECYEDVVASGLDPAEHYLKFGFKEGRQPGPNFDGNWYLRHYSDVAKKGANPLIHFIKYGQAEGRRSAPRLLGSS